MSNRHTPDFLEEQRVKLLRSRAEIQGRLDSPAHSSLVDKSEGRDIGDLGAQDTAADFTLALVERGHEALRDIDDALRRLKDGTYGVCELSGELIPVERLEVLPFARCTVKAQRNVERGGLRQRSYGVTFEDTPVVEPSEPVE
jgi:DnaK suppressor protein